MTPLAATALADTSAALSVAGHERGRADGNVAHYAGGPGIPQEEHLGPAVLPPDVPAGWSSPL